MNVVAHYVVVSERGLARNFANHSYWSVLDMIYLEHMSAGGEWDRPNILIRDGKIVVPEKLVDLAWDYGKANKEAADKAAAAVIEKLRPDWL